MVVTYTMQRTHHEGSVVSEGQQPQSHAVHDVDHPGHSGVLSERHHPLPALITHSLIVQQADILSVICGKPVIIICPARHTLIRV